MVLVAQPILKEGGPPAWAVDKRAELGWPSSRGKGWPAVCKSGPRLWKSTVPLFLGEARPLCFDKVSGGRHFFYSDDARVRLELSGNLHPGSPCAQLGLDPVGQLVLGLAVHGSLGSRRRLLLVCRRRVFSHLLFDTLKVDGVWCNHFACVDHSNCI